MGKIYSGQTDLTIQLTTGKNLTGITNVSIIYINPKLEKGLFNAVVVEPIKGVIQYAATSENDFKESGEWILYAKIVDAGGLISIGEPSTIRIYKQGS